MSLTNAVDLSDAEVRLEFPATGLELKRAAQRNWGWYGDRLLSGEERLSDARDPHRDPSGPCDTATFPTEDPKPDGVARDRAEIFVKMAPSFHIRDVFARAAAREVTGPPAKRTTITVVTAGSCDLVDFKRSAAALVTLRSREDDCHVVAWRVQVRDTEQRRTFESVTPERLRGLVRWHFDPLLDEDGEGAEPACDVPEAHWIALLRPGDMISTEFLAVLKFYMRRHPACRCFFSPAASYNIADNSLEFPRNRNPSDLFEADGAFPYIPIVRRDCWRSLPQRRHHGFGHDAYGLALRISAHEPVLLMPEYLAGRFAATRDIAPCERDAPLVARRLLLCDLADRFPPRPDDACGQPRPKARSGLCIIRTQGRDLDLLQESIGSVLMQTTHMTACVVVHGPKALYDEVARWLDLRRHRLVLLHAWRSARKRGYPLNVGLDYLRRNVGRYDFFCFLDDDDILYPLYAERLTWALFNSQADIVYGLSNQRTPWLAAQPGHVAKPTGFLVASNFIPIHAYIVRTSLILHQPIRFREDMDYLEDWDFILALLKLSARIAHLPEFLCEYRLIQDGNVDDKRDMRHYEECRDRVLALGQFVADLRGPRELLLELANFDLTNLGDPSPVELEHARQTWAMTLSKRNL